MSGKHIAFWSAIGWVDVKWRNSRAGNGYVATLRDDKRRLATGDNKEEVIEKASAQAERLLAIAKAEGRS